MYFYSFVYIALQNIIIVKSDNNYKDIVQMTAMYHFLHV